jgi:DICT domain-containing protein
VPVSRIPDSGRLAVEDSLFDRLRELRPDLPVMRATKATLAASSHLIETLVSEHQERCVLVSGFQHGRHWAAERDRYLEIAGEHDVIAVFAGRDPIGTAVDHVGLRLRTGDPLAQEWFVLALGPGLAVTLCGLDGLAHAHTADPVLEADRLFDVVWSVQPDVARLAADVVVEAVRRSAPEQAPAIAARLADVVDSREPSLEEAAGPPTCCSPGWSSAWRWCGSGRSGAWVRRARARAPSCRG